MNNIPSISIEKIKFNNDFELDLNDNDIVVFVGPNNVGKSRTLKEIKSNIMDTNSVNNVIIKEIKYQEKNFSKDNLLNFFEKNYPKNDFNSYKVILDNSSSIDYNNYDFVNIEDTSLSNKNLYKPFFNYLSTENRLNITKEIDLSHIHNYRYNIKIYEKLNKDIIMINKLNEILFNNFNKMIETYESNNGDFYVKGYKYGNKDDIEKAISINKRDTCMILDNLEKLSDQGDGIRSAVGILSTFITSNNSIYLLDEPETFLHPPQARALGQNISTLSNNKQVFISTHNIDLIKGLIENNSSRVKIIKIDREDNTNYFNPVDNDCLKQLANNRMLRHTNILNGLFYRKVVLCEDETDCKFYSIILDTLDKNLSQNILFCALGGKDQFKIIANLLNKLHIDYIIIADLDLINEQKRLKELINNLTSNNNLYKIIEQYHIKFIELYQKENNIQSKSLEDIQSKINKIFSEYREYSSKQIFDRVKEELKEINKFSLLKSDGKSSIPSGKCYENYEKIIRFLNKNNVFLVECGEIENFIRNVDGHSSNWLEKVLVEYPDLSDSKYDDVKLFLKKIFNIN